MSPVQIVIKILGRLLNHSNMGQNINRAQTSDKLPVDGAADCWISHSSKDPLSYFSFQPMLHNWCNKVHGMYYPVCDKVHEKEPLLLIGKSGSRYPLLLSKWSLTTSLTPYNHKLKVLSASVNKTFPSFLHKHDNNNTFHVWFLFLISKTTALGSHLNYLHFFHWLTVRQIHLIIFN